MDRSAIDSQRRFVHRLCKRGVGMATAGDIFATGSELDRYCRFGDEISCPCADDVHTEDTIGFGIGEDLHATFG